MSTRFDVAGMTNSLKLLTPTLSFQCSCQGAGWASLRTASGRQSAPQILCACFYFNCEQALHYFYKPPVLSNCCHSPVSDEEPRIFSWFSTAAMCPSQGSEEVILWRPEHVHVVTATCWTEFYPPGDMLILHNYLKTFSLHYLLSRKVT